MRTTIALDDYVLAAAKRRARELDLTLGRLVELALQRELARADSEPDRPVIPVFRAGAGVRPGVDISSTRTLLETLDQGEPLDRLR